MIELDTLTPKPKPPMNYNQWKHCSDQLFIFICITFLFWYVNQILTLAILLTMMAIINYMVKQKLQ